MSRKNPGTLTRLGSSALYILFRAFALLPDFLLYLFSDFLAFLARDIVGYRRKVVRSNIDSSFPELPEKERRRIARKFYNWLADYFMETVKLSGMSRRGIMRRMRFEGIDKVNGAFAEGRSVVLYLGHYGNWEWISSLPLHFPDNVASGQIYHPLEDEVSDRVFLKLRGRFGAVSIPMEKTLRVLLGWKREGKPSVTGFIADQAPGLDNTHLWLDFLNHDTPVFTGPERMARKLKAAVFYCDVERLKRGRYLCRMVEMTRDASACEEFALSREYFRMLEQTIRRRPELWLWSHRRWKHTREHFLSIYGEEGARRLEHISRVGL